jgi:hypothetical protein
LSLIVRLHVPPAIDVTLRVPETTASLTMPVHPLTVKVPFEPRSVRLTVCVWPVLLKASAPGAAASVPDVAGALGAADGVEVGDVLGVGVGVTTAGEGGPGDVDPQAHRPKQTAAQPSSDHRLHADPPTRRICLFLARKPWLYNKESTTYLGRSLRQRIPTAFKRSEARRFEFTTRSR